jgi:integrase/recombinase XerD
VGKGKKRVTPRWAERDRWLSKEEATELLAHVNRHGDLVSKVLVNFILGTGMRVSEVAKAEFEHIRNINTRPEIWTRGKGSKERIIPLDPKLATMLDRYRVIRESGKSIKGRWNKKVNGDPRIFPYSTMHIWRLWGAAVRNAGLVRGFHTHAARHSFISAVMKKKDIRTAADIAGHASIKTTALYVHSSDEERREAVTGLWD